MASTPIAPAIRQQRLSLATEWRFSSLEFDVNNLSGGGGSATRTTVQRVDPNIRSKASSEFKKALQARVVGQDEAVQALVDLFQVYTAGLNSPGRPVGNLLFWDRRAAGRHTLWRPLRKFCSEAVGR